MKNFKDNFEELEARLWSLVPEIPRLPITPMTVDGDPTAVLPSDRLSTSQRGDLRWLYGALLRGKLSSEDIKTCLPIVRELGKDIYSHLRIRKETK